jgi:hypothetical protein
MRRSSGGSRSSRRGSRRCRRDSGTALSPRNARASGRAGGAESSAPWDSRRSVHGVGDGKEAFSAEVSNPFLRVGVAVEGVSVESSGRSKSLNMAGEKCSDACARGRLKHRQTHAGERGNRQAEESRTGRHGQWRSPISADEHSQRHPNQASTRPFRHRPDLAWFPPIPCGVGREARVRVWVGGRRTGAG